MTCSRVAEICQNHVELLSLRCARLGGLPVIFLSQRLTKATIVTLISLPCWLTGTIVATQGKDEWIRQALHEGYPQSFRRTVQLDQGRRGGLINQKSVSVPDVGVKDGRAGQYKSGIQSVEDNISGKSSCNSESI